MNPRTHPDSGFSACLCLKSLKYTKFSLAFQASSDEKSTRQSAHVDFISDSLKKHNQQRPLGFPEGAFQTVDKVGFCHCEPVTDVTGVAIRIPRKPHDI